MRTPVHAAPDILEDDSVLSVTGADNPLSRVAESSTARAETVAILSWLRRMIDTRARHKIETTPVTVHRPPSVVGRLMIASPFLAGDRTAKKSMASRALTAADRIGPQEQQRGRSLLRVAADSSTEVVLPLRSTELARMLLEGRKHAARAHKHAIVAMKRHPVATIAKMGIDDAENEKNSTSGGEAAAASARCDKHESIRLGDEDPLPEVEKL